MIVDHIVAVPPSPGEQERSRTRDGSHADVANHGNLPYGGGTSGLRQKAIADSLFSSSLGRAKLH
jgi:hypothetical protein